MQNVHEHSVPQHGGAPSHALPRKFVEPILFLADRMVHLTPGMREAKALLRDLAESAGMADYAQQAGYRQLDERKACALLGMETAKRGALVLMALMLKAGPDAGDAHRTYFTRVRTLMEAEPVSVPVSLQEHKRLVQGFLGH